jgi:hypothetical protein
VKNNTNTKSQNHLNEYRSAEKKKLSLSLSITFAAMIIEFIGGYISNSLAFISDAGHMITHCFAIGIGLTAILIAVKTPPCHHRTYRQNRRDTGSIYQRVISAGSSWLDNLRSHRPHHQAGRGFRYTDAGYSSNWINRQPDQYLYPARQ